MISANRNQAPTDTGQIRWCKTDVTDFPGPMAGLEAAVQACEGLCLCLPCDLLQPSRFHGSGSAGKGQPLEHVCVAQDPIRRQPLCLALHAEPWRSLSSPTIWMERWPSQRLIMAGWISLMPVHALM